MSLVHEGLQVLSGDQGRPRAGSTRPTLALVAQERRRRMGIHLGHLVALQVLLHAGKCYM